MALRLVVMLARVNHRRCDTVAHCGCSKLFQPVQDPNLLVCNQNHQQSMTRMVVGGMRSCHRSGGKALQDCAVILQTGQRARTL